MKCVVVILDGHPDVAKIVATGDFLASLLCIHAHQRHEDSRRDSDCQGQGSLQASPIRKTFTGLRLSITLILSDQGGNRAQASSAVGRLTCRLSILIARFARSQGAAVGHSLTRFRDEIDGNRAIYSHDGGEVVELP